MLIVPAKPPLITMLCRRITPETRSSDKTGGRFTFLDESAAAAGVMTVKAEEEEV